VKARLRHDRALSAARPRFALATALRSISAPDVRGYFLSVGWHVYGVAPRRARGARPGVAQMALG
jgi:hypothetical protein